MLSFDVEEYFHAEAAAAGLGRDQWDAMPKRLEAAVERILQLLADHEAGATFFVLGWVARHERAVVEKIARAGHEVASHGMTHAMLHRLTPDEFGRELADSKAILEDISGRPVIGYRAPTFSITRATAWAIDELVGAGFTYDSSIFPIRHDRYGVPDAPPWPHRAVGPAGGSLLEIPPLTMRLLGMNLPVGGGGYLRLLPVGFAAAGLRRVAKAGLPGMLYMHPWEIDPGQPVLPMGALARWRHRVGLARAEGKLRWLLEHFRFRSVAQCLDQVSAQATQSFPYGQP
jgi:polysaccharide deacetylase family protein (PEP-CTERM system associated)